MRRTLQGMALGAALLLGGCGVEPSASAQDQTGNAAVPAAVAPPVVTTSPAPAASETAGDASPLAKWLVGRWSFEPSCASDFVVQYDADGTVENGGESGRWALDGDALTETLTERYDMEADAPQKLDPPEKRTYRVVQKGADTGTITYRGRTITIRRC